MLKWTATSLIIIATVCRSLNLHVADVVIGGIGTLMWAYCAYKMNDKALLTVNVFCVLVLTAGLFNLK